MKKTLMILAVAVLAALAGAVPAGAAAVVGSGGRADVWAPTAPPGSTGPQGDEVALGSFVAPARTAAGRHGAADSFKGGPGCSIQCITSGVAYGRGPDARLVVTTDSPAQITIVVSRNGYVSQQTSDPGVTIFEADFNDLEADTHYTGFVSAVDGSGQIANRSGSFTTLQRNVQAHLAQALVTDRPYGNEPFAQEVWFEGEVVSESYGERVDDDGVLLLGLISAGAEDTDRYLELQLELAQYNGTDDLCEVHEDDEGPEFGQFHCDYTAYAEFDGGSLDLDDRPWDAGYWNSYEIDADLVLATDYYSPLVFTVPLTVDVTWTHG